MKNKGAYAAIVWCVIAVLFIGPGILGALFSSLFGISHTDKAQRSQEKSYRQIEYTELTPEQRLEDFDYFYNMIKTSLPAVYDMRESFSYSVLDREQTYREMVAECTNDYEFAALMFAMINDIPRALFCPIIPTTSSRGISARTRSGCRLQATSRAR